MAVKPRLWTRGFILDTLVNFLIYIIYYMLVVIIASEAIHSLHATVSEAGLAAGIFVLGTLAARLVAGRSVLEPGVNRHFEPGEFDQFQPKKNSQQSSAIVNYSKRWSIFVPSKYYNVGFPVRRVILSSPCPR